MQFKVAKLINNNKPETRDPQSNILESPSTLLSNEIIKENKGCTINIYLDKWTEDNKQPIHQNG